jgi:predicted DNA-binding protein
MTMTKPTQSLPRTAEELEALASYYDTHDTSSEMEDGEWIDPRPMKTASLRLPSDVLEALKTLAKARGMRYTAFIREIIEQVVNGESVAAPEKLDRIDQRLARIEEAVVDHSDTASPRRAPARTTVAAKARQRDVTLPKQARKHDVQTRRVKALRAAASPRGSRLK